MTQPLAIVPGPEAQPYRLMTVGRPPSVVVIGGGIAGLACADRLSRYRFRIRIFDKARGLGGRTATRRAEPYCFDHGAQYFTARHPVFERRVEGWLASGVAALWKGAIRVLDGGRISRPETEPLRYVGVPGMSAIARGLAGGMSWETGVRVEELRRVGRHWRPRAAGRGDLGSYDLAVVAVPPAQAAPLLAASGQLAARAAAVTMLPTWAVMAAFERPLDLPFDGAFVHRSPLSWIARNGSKTGRRPEECWVLHATQDWSRNHLEETPERVTETLLAAFSEAAGQALAPLAYRAAHRWRYALPERCLSERCLFDPALGLGACGDWCGGPRIEGAFLSGWTLAARILAAFGDMEAVPG